MAEKRSQSAQKHVYIISDGVGNVKVGIAKAPEQRLRRFQTGNARRLSLHRSAPFTGVRPNGGERYAHWLMRSFHVGGEWFAIEEKLALANLMGAVIAVVAGVRAPRPGFGGVGRPKLGVKETKMRLPIGLPERIDALVGEQKRAEFIRKAVVEAVEKAERAKPKKPDQ